MKNKLLLSAAVVLLCSAAAAKAQDQGPLHGRSTSYTWPKEQDVLDNLDKWQDLKFGMLIHWGLYSQLGVVESWSICSEEEDWIKRDSTVSYEEYKRSYWALIDEFNPVRFDPAAWAATGKAAGMNYVVFTTKHHDGFCMFDTRHTDFSITKGAFRNDPRNNVAKELFGAFRDQGYMIGAYFSKPDWHSQYYWWDRYATPNRNNNYDIASNPWRWEKFKEFTYNQIEEIVGGDYGRIDILWLDGGWVRPARPTDAQRQGRAYKGAQDIDMPKIAAMVKRNQPGIIMVDRAVAGEFENYQTPERGIPDTRLTHPWESCITLGNDWGWVPDDPYKSPREVVHMLVEIVSKGGNLVLGIGPKPVKVLLNGYTWVIRGTPLMLTLFFMVYGLPAIGLKLPPFTGAVIAYALTYGAFLTEIIRGGLESIDRGQFEACKVLGMSYAQAMRRVIIPQTVRRVLPPACSEAINLVKDTALLAAIGIADMYRAAKQVFTRDMNIAAFVLLFALYLLLSSVLVKVFGIFEKKYALPSSISPGRKRR